MAESPGQGGKRSASISPSVEIPEWLRGSGMECFTTLHLPGFQADIKTIPDDFVVTEIDFSGQLVQLDPPSPTSHSPNLLSLLVPTTDEGVSLDDKSLSISVPTTSTGSEGVPLEDSLITEEEQSAAADSSASESGPETTAVGSSSSERGKMVKSRPDISSVPPLNELITEEQYKALSEMAEKLKTTLDPQLGENICLGEIPDRERRGFVHNAVRLAFPVLKTKATRNEADYQSILEAENPELPTLRINNYIPA